MRRYGRRLPRTFFEREVETVAGDLLGRVIVVRAGDGAIAVRLTEVEAYAGQDDPASHAFRGRSPRTAVMFGPAGHLYTYFVYGMHWCANIVTGPDGEASAVLLRAGAVVHGLEAARARRPRVRRDHELARGPAGLASVLGFGSAANGTDLCAHDGGVRLCAGDPSPSHRTAVGPRVGVAAGADIHRRFWIEQDPTVSVYRAWAPRRRAGIDAAAIGSG